MSPQRREVQDDIGAGHLPRSQLMLRHPFRAVATALVAILLLSACETPPGLEQELRAIIPAQEDSGLDPVTYVNTLTYTWQDPVPAMIAWRTVTATRGWDPATIEAWAPFVQAVMGRESGYCWNTRRGARIDVWEGCHVARQGGHSDSGFGQVLMGYPNKRGWYLPVNGGVWGLHENASYLCPQEGLCQPNDVIASPWASMTALVALVERAGRQPWCYTAKLRRGAVCRLAP